MTDDGTVAGPARERFDRARRMVEAHRFQEGADLLADLVVDLEGVGDPTTSRLLVRALTASSTAHHEVGDVDRARDMADRAWHLADEAGFDDLLVAALSVKAYNLTRSGDPDGALATLEGAAPSLPRIDTEDRLRFLLNRAFAGLACGDVQSSLADLQQVEEEGRAAGLYDLAQKARHNLGYVAFMRGDLPRALELMSSTVVDPDEVPSVARLARDPISLMDRAQVLSEAGLVDEADDLLEGALLALSEQGRVQDEGEVHLARGRATLIEGDHDLATAHVEGALAAFAARGNRRWIRRANFTRLAIEVERGQREAARHADGHGHTTAPPTPTVDGDLVARIDDLARAARDANDPDLVEPARFMLAEAALLVGRPDTTRAVLARGGPSESAPLSVRMRWYRARAGLAAVSGPDALQDVVREALGELSAAQSRLGSLDLRTAMAIHGREIAQLGVVDALRRTDDEALHLAVEGAHASSTRLAPVRATGSAAERDQLARLRRTKEALWSTDADRDPDEVARLRRDVTRLERALRQRGWQRSGEDERAAVVSLPETRDALSTTGATAISFVAVGARLHAIVVDRSGLRPVSLGDLDDLLDLVHRLRSDLQAVVLPGIPPAVRVVMQRSVLAILAELDRALLTATGVGDAPLVVVPHGALALVPWALLPSRRGAATTTTPCMTSWVRATERHHAGTHAGMGDAVDHDLDRTTVVAMAGPGLDRATDEVAAVARVWPRARAVTGGDATGATAVAALVGAEIVHLAAHGRHQATSPLFSSVRLHDGPLFAHELDHHVKARLVVLSACEVGSQTVREGDEPLGLTAALLQAGTPTVLAGLARVDDHLAHDVMVEVHRNMRGSQSPALALSAAMDAAMADRQVAPFGCSGVGLAPLG